VEDDRVDVLDFKTDAPPTGPVEQTYPKYAAQVRLYGSLVEAAGVLKNHRFRCGLLFTANGSIHWLA
jgi:ATP-dependent exoDNAse (exonuclease V) beta subunit